jgi:FAD:protein FMN transferase
VIFRHTHIVLILFFTSNNVFSQLKRFQFEEKKMGSPFQLIFYDYDSLHAFNLAKNAFLIVDSLNNSFSDYSSTSEIAKINDSAGNGQFINISKDLEKILLQSKTAYLRSEAAFDITLGQLTKLWRKSRQEKKLPSSIELKTKLAAIGIKYLVVDTTKHCAKLLKKGASIDLGGIGKGYAAQKVYEFFAKNNIKKVLVNAAGNMAIGDAPIGKKGWEIEIERPTTNSFLNPKMVNLSNIAISTSGDAFQFVEINGKRYAHIINPKTGLGLSYQRQVTIICENATKADWLSTACYILPIKRALILAKKEKAEILIFNNNNNKITEIKSAGFNKYIK